MAIITTSTTFRNLKATLDNIVTDKNDGLAAQLDYFKRETMDENYVDDAEVAGPAVATEKAEGQDLDVGDLTDGYITRYIARKFGLKMLVSEEALEDGKYDKYVDAARRLKRALMKTMSIDGANVLNRATSSSYTGGDGVALASASHTLPAGGTFSNTLSTPFAPSRAALIVVTTNCMKLPDHTGVVEGYMPEAIVCPVDQWAAWEGIVGSAQVPESANNEINVINKNTMGMKLKIIPVKYWTASTTNWLVTTDAPDGLKWKDRRKPKSRTWVDNDAEVMKYGISARWARGWSDPRGVYFSNA